MMDQLIPVINKLQEVFAAIQSEDSISDSSLSLENLSGNIDLPKIVVVGAQSSGKSSVLESLVQRDFLPRGKDIVTRRPLVLQLVHTTSGASEWAEFAHLPGKKFTDFLAVRREIEGDTERVAGTNKGISRVPIQLRIHSPHVVNLTLVDLPGITKIPVGEQPADIEAQIRQLVLDYISRPNSIILAVTPANTDLANSDALKVAREVDPQGHRTIGVLTKLDLMDAGTHAAEILMNRAEFRLKLGFIGVVNRSQHDININKAINDALQQEMTFFKTHPHYRSIAHRCGTQFLARELNKILLNHIRDQLPELRTKINSLIIATQCELTSLGDLGLPHAHKGSLLLRLVTNYVADFHAAIEGTLRIDNPSEELMGGAKISYIFNSLYANSIAQVDASSGLSLTDIRNAIRNASGPRPALFVPEASFEMLCRKQIAKLETPAQKCVDLVFEELQRLVHRVEKKEFRRFPVLTAKLVEAAAELLRVRLEPTLSMIEGLIRIEMAYINTNHPDFCRTGASLGLLAKLVDEKKHAHSTVRLNKSASDDFPSLLFSNNPSVTAPPNPSNSHNHNNAPLTPAASPTNQEGGILSYLFRGQMVPGSGGNATNKSPPNAATLSPKKRYPIPGDGEQQQQLPPSSPLNTATEALLEKEEIETQLIMTLLHSYFNIVRKNLLDSVPKAIMYYLVGWVQENLGTHLVGQLYKEELFGELLREDESVVKQRARCRTALEAYRQAATILADLRDADVQ